MEQQLLNYNTTLEIAIWIIPILLSGILALLIYIWRKNESRQDKQEKSHKDLENKMFSLMQDIHTQQKEFTRYSSRVEVLVEKHEGDIKNLYSLYNNGK